MNLEHSLKYFHELGIVPFINKNNIVPQKQNIEVLIIAQNPNNESLIQLFKKISDSIKLINKSITYRTILYNTPVDILILSDKYEFNKLIIFDNNTNLNLDIIITSYNISNSNSNSNNILHGYKLTDLQTNPDFKKQLWLNLKSFL
jgi:DNA polymerase III psi subunit